MSENNELQQGLQRIEGLVRAIEEAPDSRVRSSALELVQTLMQLHAAGLDRLMEMVYDDGSGRAAVDRLASDGLVSSLLLLHGLHPDDVETRVRRALDSVRPYLHSHGGDVDLLGVDEGVVRLRLRGSCNGCASSSLTLKNLIEDAIYEAAPDVTGLDVADAADEPAVPALVQLGRSPRRDGSHAGAFGNRD